MPTHKKLAFDLFNLHIVLKEINNRQDINLYPPKGVNTDIFYFDTVINPNALYIYVKHNIRLLERFFTAVNNLRKVYNFKN